jgi:DNA-binding NarL/FixJ family response regulator
MNSSAQSEFRLKVLFVEDEEFTISMVCELLQRKNFDVLAVRTVAEAVDALESFAPNVIISDLDLGFGPDGSDLLNHVDAHFPWIGKVILTSHYSPELAISPGTKLPQDIAFLIKNRVTPEEIYDAIFASLKTGPIVQLPKFVQEEGLFEVSKGQAELLKLMADGYSNSAIARKRNRTLKSTESMIHRLFISLNISSHPDINPRIVAVRMWQQGKVVVR